MRDNLSTQQVVHLGNVAVSGTTPAASAWVDTKGFESATIVLVANTVTDAGTAAGFTASVQDGSTTVASAAAAIVAADSVDGEIAVTVTSDAADNTNAGGIGYVGNERYVRMNIVGTTGSDADCSVLAILGNPDVAPTTFIGVNVAAT